MSILISSPFANFGNQSIYELCDVLGVFRHVLPKNKGVPWILSRNMYLYDFFKPRLAENNIPLGGKKSWLNGG